MKTAFLIINYNDSITTIRLIDNIKNYECLDKILVVDNNSTDDSYNEIQKICNRKIEIVKNIANKGYGSGINFGVKCLTNLYKKCHIIISNPDIEINSEEDIIKLLSSFDDDTAVVAPIIKEHTGLNRGWRIPTPLQDCLLNIIYIHKYLRPKLLFYEDKYYKKNIVSVEAISGCFFIIDSDVLGQIDYFDENMFLYYEENVLATKLKAINKLTKINTKVSVFHNHSVTIDKNINKIKKYKELKKSQMYFQKKYNSANVFEVALLFITNKLTLLLLSVVYLFKR